MKLRTLWLWFSLVVFASAAHSASLSERQYRVIEKAQSALTEGDYDEVIDITQDPSEKWAAELGRVLALQIRAQAFQLLDQPSKAREALQQAYDMSQAGDILDDERLLSLATQLAQLYLLADQPQRARQSLLPLLEGREDASPPSYILLAVSYQMESRWSDVLPWVKKATKAEDVPESWLSLQAAAELQTKAFLAATKTLTRLITRSPQTRSYWVQLAGAFQQSGNDQMQLASLEMARQYGVLTDDLSVYLAAVEAAEGVPERAARSLAQVMNKTAVGDVVDSVTPTQLAAYHQQARDWRSAVTVLAEDATARNDTDDYSRAVQLAQSAGLCDQTIALSQTEGLLSGSAMLAIGQCYLESSPDDARPWFQRAQSYPETTVAAEKWLAYWQAMKQAGLI
ncbi:MAG: hypothetical protein VXZ05_03680 [Pseudomonadota bacterium]|nr:hypothetical protein [Pseudomonadota bacterium]